MTGYSTIPFDNSKFDFVKVVKDLFCPKYSCELDDIHQVIKEKYQKLFQIGSDSSTVLHKMFYDKYREGWDELSEMYEMFIRDEVSKTINEPFLYQSFPTYRCHLTNNVAVGAFHNDAEFGHPDGEINYIIPLTNSSNTASVWVESEPGKRDFEAMYLRIGQLVVFDGNHLTHGNKVNVSNKTRMSMDFRILPLSKYDEHNAKESITTKTKYVEGGYYKRFNK